MGDRDSDLLVCDGNERNGCENVCHFDCCGLPSVPTGDWYCDDCSTNSTSMRTSRRRRTPQPQIVLTANGQEYTAENLAQVMHDAVQLDLLMRDGSLENRGKLLPKVISHLRKWRSEGGLEFRRALSRGVLNAIAQWMWPGNEIETGMRAENMRFSLLQYIKSCLSSLTFKDVKKSGIGVAIVKCSRSTHEAERNRFLQDSILNKFVQLSVEQRQLQQQRRGLLERVESYKASASSSSRDHTDSPMTTAATRNSTKNPNYALPASTRSIPAKVVGSAAVAQMLSAQSEARGLKRRVSSEPKTFLQDVQRRHTPQKLSLQDRRKKLSNALRNVIHSRVLCTHTKYSEKEQKKLTELSTRASFKQYPREVKHAIETTDVIYHNDTDMDVVKKTLGLTSESMAFNLDNIIQFAEYDMPPRS
uniref:PHD-type domain-containing protein n=1 Tax=Mucochytrium quahogii TaxID=96639 RepID=A0A7S2WCG3_9STRA